MHAKLGRATVAPVAGDDPRNFPDDEPVTGTVCLACGGEFRVLEETATGHREAHCPHCTRGTMSPKQEVAWRLRRKGRAPP